MTEPPSVDELSDLCDKVRDLLEGKQFVLLVLCDNGMIVTGLSEKHVTKALIREAFVESTRHI